MSSKLRLNVVNSLIMSRLTYGINIWGNTTDSTIKRVQRVQNLAARLALRTREENEAKNFAQKLQLAQHQRIDGLPLSNAIQEDNQVAEA